MFKFIKRVLCTHSYETLFMCNVIISTDGRDRGTLVEKKCIKCGKIKVTV